MLSDLPILGVCGWSGAGKTTLIESILPLLKKRNLRVAVVKHTHHQFDLDRPGKDSDRLYNSGADVIGQSPYGNFLRLHENNETPIEEILIDLSKKYDLILVEGGKQLPIDKVWLHHPNKTEIPNDLTRVLARYNFGSDRLPPFAALIEEWLLKQWRRIPVYACVLIGGQSRRMGTPKHLLQCGNETLLERTVRILKSITNDIVLTGRGVIPDSLHNLTRIPDAPVAQGPMSGLLSAMRWNPNANWLAVACDLPMLSEDALSWLLSQRLPGRWAMLPCLEGSEHAEPLLAYYDFRAKNLIESLAAKNDYRLSNLTTHPKIKSPIPPKEIELAWKNVNTPEEWKELWNKIS